MRKTTPIMVRLLAKTVLGEIPEGYAKPCRLFTGVSDGRGYGQIWDGDRMRRTHVVAWEHETGQAVPPGHVLDHGCRRRSCCEPEHAEPVTGRTNTLRGVGPSAVNAAKTHCHQGHELNGANMRRNNRGQRICKACLRSKRAQDRRRKAS